LEARTRFLSRPRSIAALIAAKNGPAGRCVRGDVNDHAAFRTGWMPFAGRRVSGFGVDGIPYTMQEMTAEKMIVFKR